jgi:hypothetical protein
LAYPHIKAVIESENSIKDTWLLCS